MRMSEKCHYSNYKHTNSNSDNPLTSRHTDGGKNWDFKLLKNHICLGNFLSIHKFESLQFVMRFPVIYDCSRWPLKSRVFWNRAKNPLRYFILSKTVYSGSLRGRVATLLRDNDTNGQRPGFGRPRSRFLRTGIPGQGKRTRTGLTLTLTIFRLIIILAGKVTNFITHHVEIFGQIIKLVTLMCVFFVP